MLRKVIVLITVFSLVLASSLCVFADVYDVTDQYGERLYGATSSYAFLDIWGLSSHLAVFYSREQPLDGTDFFADIGLSSSCDTLEDLNYRQDRYPNSTLFTFCFQLEVPASYFDKTLLFYFTPYVELILTDCMEYEEYYATPYFSLSDVTLLDDEGDLHGVSYRVAGDWIFVDPSSVAFSPSGSRYVLSFCFKATAGNCDIDPYWDQTFEGYFDSCSARFYSDDYALFYSDLTLQQIYDISDWDDVTGDLEDAANGLVTPKPDLDNIDTDVVPDDGLNSINSVLSVITSDPNFLGIMVMSATLMLVSYIFFGKRG